MGNDPTITSINPRALLPAPANLRDLWSLKPDVIYTNNGSFGLCPLAVQLAKNSFSDRFNTQPVQSLAKELEPLLDASRARLAGVLGANPENLVFVRNATTGVNAVLRSLTFKSGDEILVTSHEYNATRNVVDFVAESSGARVAVVELPAPIANSEEIADRISAGFTDRTRLLVFDHVTSQTGLVLPAAEIVRRAQERGIETFIDGAHAAGMIPLDLEALGASYYSGTCHKWLCAPLGTGYLYVTPECQRNVRPTVISHGANSTRTDKSRFQIEFGWVGTDDWSSFLALPTAIDFLEGLRPGGLAEVMQRNRALALDGRALLMRELNLVPLGPEEMHGSMAAFFISDGDIGTLHDAMLERYKIESQIMQFPAAPRRVLRISAQQYNTIADYERMIEPLRALL